MVRRLALMLALLGFLAACASPPPAPQPTLVPSIAWTPRTRVPAATLTQEEKLTIRLASLEQERQAYGLEPMAYPELRRWIYPEERASVLVPCLKDKGFFVSPSADGTGISGAVPSPQNAAFGRASLECKAMFSLDPRLEVRDYDKERAELFYEYYSEYVIPCVRRHGYTISDLPSKEVWLANIQPLDGYPNGDSAVARECPYNVPTPWLLGDR